MVEGLDPKRLLELYEAAIKVLSDYRQARTQYLDMQKAADIALRLASDEATRVQTLWAQYQEAANALSDVHRDMFGVDSESDLLRTIQYNKEK